MNLLLLQLPVSLRLRGEQNPQHSSQHSSHYVCKQVVRQESEPPRHQTPCKCPQRVDTRSSLVDVVEGQRGIDGGGSRAEHLLGKLVVPKQKGETEYQEETGDSLVEHENEHAVGGTEEDAGFLGNDFVKDVHRNGELDEGGGAEGGDGLDEEIGNPSEDLGPFGEDVGESDCRVEVRLAIVFGDPEEGHVDEEKGNHQRELVDGIDVEVDHGHPGEINEKKCSNEFHLDFVEQHLNL